MKKIRSNTTTNKENLSVSITFHVTPEEFSVIKDHAKAEQLSISQYTRSRLLWYSSYPQAIRFHERHDRLSTKIYYPKHKGLISTHDLSLSRKTEELYRKERRKVENIPDGWVKLLTKNQLFDKKSEKCQENSSIL